MTQNRLRFVRYYHHLLVIAFAACSAPASEPPEDEVAGASAGVRQQSPTTIAEGLNSPRGLATDQADRVYVVEAGLGGPAPCVVGATGDTGCFGLTGRVSRIDRNGLTVLSDGLPSIASQSGTSVLGPHDVLIIDGGLLVATGFGYDPSQREVFGGDGSPLGTVSFAMRGGFEWTIADLAAFEQDQNPDGLGVLSNPYGMARDRDLILVADAGGNDLLAVRPDGVVELLATFPTRLVPAPPGFPVTELPMESVPTSVAVGPDGAYYVGEFTGFPFPPGFARVYRVVPGQSPQVFLEGFTSIIDLAFDLDGNLLVLEHATHGLLSGDPSGALIRVDSAGERHPIDTVALTYPTSVTVDLRSRIYVSDCGTCGPGTGSVVRL